MKPWQQAPTHDECASTYECDHCGRPICRACCRGVHHSRCALCEFLMPRSLPDFPGDGPFDVRTMFMDPPCFACGRYHDWNMTGPELRTLLLAAGPTRR